MENGTVHQYNENMLPESVFVPGSLKFLVVGNECRRMDARRTPGVVERISFDEGMFRWRILDFEDKGKYWDVPLEDVSRFQFNKTSSILEKESVEALVNLVSRFDVMWDIPINEKAALQTADDLQSAEENAKTWFMANSQCMKQGQKPDWTLDTGSKLLFEDLKAYMTSVDLYELEKRTAEKLVLNPHSGEWIKGMAIVLAEMGLVPYHQKIPRERNIFNGTGEKCKRRAYLIHRMAFIRAYFKAFDITEVVLYRGMSSEFGWAIPKKTFSSWSFHAEVAHSFFDPKVKAVEGQTPVKNGYLMMRTVPVTHIFMTYLETIEMNHQYKEAEALLFFSENESYL